MAPLIFVASSRKRWKVREAMQGDAWLFKMKISTNLTMDHIEQIVNIWALSHAIHLVYNTEDDITWKHTTFGHYSAASAYKAQFLGLVLSPMDKMVWKVWAPPKVKFFAWLALQDRIWTADRLAKRGWPNCDLCPLCKREQESGSHLFFKCRFSRRLWSLVIDKYHVPDFVISTWPLFDSVQSWWASTCDDGYPHRQAKASLTMLVSWTIETKCASFQA